MKLFICKNVGIQVMNPTFTNTAIPQMPEQENRPSERVMTPNASLRVALRLLTIVLDKRRIITFHPDRKRTAARENSDETKR